MKTPAKFISLANEFFLCSWTLWVWLEKTYFIFRNVCKMFLLFLFFVELPIDTLHTSLGFLVASAQWEWLSSVPYLVTRQGMSEEDMLLFRYRLTI